MKTKTNQTNQIIETKEESIGIGNNHSTNNKGIDESFYNHDSSKLILTENSVSEINSCFLDRHIEKMPTQLESFSLAIGILAVALFW